MELRKIEHHDYMCNGAVPTPTLYNCQDSWGVNVCAISVTTGLPYNFCASRCMNEGNFFTDYLRDMTNALSQAPEE
jgi:hypothetical protein